MNCRHSSHRLFFFSERVFFTFLYTIFWGLTPLVARGDVKVPHVFGTHMTLQAGVEAPIWGLASPGENVVIEIGNQKFQTQANDAGQWKIKLPVHEEGGPFTLKISGRNKLIFKDVYFGDVWIFVGQNNMKFPLKRVKNARTEIDEAKFSRIHFLTVPERTAEQPLTDIDSAEWQICSPKTVENFSAIAYYFGRNIHESLKKPVGLIVLAVDGSTCEAWTDGALFSQDPILAPLVSSERLTRLQDCQKTGRLYNGMVLPICPFAIKGIVWYQGESNTSRAYQYKTLFPHVISNWRKIWNQDDVPFYFVQLPNFMKVKDLPCSSAWAEFREAQHSTLSQLENTFEVVSIDVGDANNLTPHNKETIANRLSNLALSKTYQKQIPCGGPIFKSMKVNGSEVSIVFDNIGAGLKVLANEESDDSMLRGFSVAGEDQKFFWANAEIRGNTVVLSSPNVLTPVAVRYAWADNPVCNLSNSYNLPASPFRTDDWLGTTANTF